MTIFKLIIIFKKKIKENSYKKKNISFEQFSVLVTYIKNDMFNTYLKALIMST